MQGTILILDGVATNRIMLKVQLSSAYYNVVQAEGLEGLFSLVQRTRPDLIVTGMTLPDGDATEIRRILRDDDKLRSIPIIAVTSQNDQASRLRALAGSIDDVLSHPLDDRMLQARIRSLISIKNGTNDLQLRDGTSRALGFAEPMAGFKGPASIALITREAATGVLWRTKLQNLVSHQLLPYSMDNMGVLVSKSQPVDVIIVEVSRSPDDQGMRVMADLRARDSTREAAIIAIPSRANANVAADALDRGAHDAMPIGFCPQELALRIAAQLQRKAQSDTLRKTVREGLRAAVKDPMTGLYNRRYALPHLAKIVRRAEKTGNGFAVMLVDLDHFKQINDRFGHQAGDAILTETASRLQNLMRPSDLVARVGGEEFLIIMQDTSSLTANRAAQMYCQAINGKPFSIPSQRQTITVTTSIGVVAGPEENELTRLCDMDRRMSKLIGEADRALYRSKEAGRNQVTMIGAVA